MRFPCPHGGRLLLSALLGCLLALVACMPAANNRPVDSRLPATQPPPPWLQSSAPVTLANAPQIASLGRLDQPHTPSTLFAYAVSPDSTRLAGLNNDQLLVWNLIDGTLVSSTSRGDANRIYFSPDKTSVYTVSPAGGVSSFHAETARSQSSFEAHANFDGVQAYDPEDGLLALGGQNGEIKVWDLLERVSRVTLSAHRLRVAALAFSPDGQRLISAGDEGMVSLWDWSNRARLKDIPLSADNPVTQIAASPDGSQFAVTNADTILVYALDDGRELRRIDMGTGGAADVFIYSPDGRYLTAGGAGHALTLWNAETGELVAQLPGMTGNRLSAAFSPDGTMLLTSALGAPVRLWDITRITAETVNNAQLPVTSTQILSARWTDDGRLLLLVDATGPIHVWGIGASPATATP